MSETKTTDDAAWEAAAPPPYTDKLASVAVRTLSGDLKSFLLDRLRDLQDKDRRPWTERPESEQRRVIQDAERIVEHMIRRAVELVATQGLPSIGGALQSVAAKDGIKAQILVGGSDEGKVMPLMRMAAGFGSKQVMLVLCDPSTFYGTRPGGEVKAKPDQPPLLADAADSPSGAEAGEGTARGDGEASEAADKPGARKRGRGSAVH